ncbi:hypothetical protein [Flavobacterium alkalisoli]|uniref:hypothetical protein n=1 Tax=Flavobacterium alkalisoli TaxID=2602769 RepID=UPI003A9169A4
MGHIKLKPTTEIKINFHPSEIKDEIIPEESKKIAQEYLSSDKTSDDNEHDLIIMLEDKIIYGYDYINNKEKFILPEINPVTIFYSNAVMSNGLIKHYKDELFKASTRINKTGKIHSRTVSPNHSGVFFQLAVNCIINLQSTLECFANMIIPSNYPFVNKQGNEITATVGYKLFNVLPKIKGIDFKNQGRKVKKYNLSIDTLIKLRNDIVHLKPIQETNTGYKKYYRELLDFDFEKAIYSVKLFINFYEPNLLEECPCGINFVYDTLKKSP